LKNGFALKLSIYNVMMSLLFLSFMIMQIVSFFGVAIFGFPSIDTGDIENSLDNIINGAVILLVYIVIGFIFLMGFQKARQKSIDGLGFFAGGVIIVAIIGVIWILMTVLSLYDFEEFEWVVSVGSFMEFFRWEFVALALIIPGFVIIKNRNKYIRIRDP